MKKHLSLVFALLGNLGDFLTFSLFTPLLKMHNKVAEVNPITKFLFKHGGLFSLFCFKVIAGSAIIVGLYFFFLDILQKREMAERITFAIGLIFWIITVYQLSLYFHFFHILRLF